jgi:hypothetical protein
MTTSVSQAKAAKLARTYGVPPDGRLLAAIAGHCLSFDHSGPPSRQETAADLTTHGEAPARRWDIQKHAKSPNPHFEYGPTLPEARIGFSRKRTLDRLEFVAGPFPSRQTNSYE